MVDCSVQHNTKIQINDRSRYRFHPPKATPSLRSLPELTEPPPPPLQLTSFAIRRPAGVVTQTHDFPSCFWGRTPTMSLLAYASFGAGAADSDSKSGCTFLTYSTTVSRNFSIPISSIMYINRDSKRFLRGPRSRKARSLGWVGFDGVFWKFGGGSIFGVFGRAGNAIFRKRKKQDFFFESKTSSSPSYANTGAFVLTTL